jgi:cytochrome b
MVVNRHLFNLTPLNREIYMKIWDLPTRLYHWLQAGLFTGLALTGIRGEGPHVYLGLALLTLLIWRVIWGLVGSETSRFRQFVRSPKAAIRYLQGQVSDRPGHNPAGAYMVIAMIAALLLQCLSGLALAGFLDPLPGSEIWLNDDIFDITVLIHENLIDGLFILVGLHLAAILFYKLRGKPLVWAMFTGQQAGKHHAVQIAPMRRALFTLAIAFSITLFLYLLSE